MNCSSTDSCAIETTAHFKRLEVEDFSETMIELRATVENFRYFKTNEGGISPFGIYAQGTAFVGGRTLFL